MRRPQRPTRPPYGTDHPYLHDAAGQVTFRTIRRGLEGRGCHAPHRPGPLARCRLVVHRVVPRCRAAARRSALDYAMTGAPALGFPGRITRAGHPRHVRVMGLTGPRRRLAHLWHGSLQRSAAASASPSPPDSHAAGSNHAPLDNGYKRTEAVLSLCGQEADRSWSASAGEATPTPGSSARPARSPQPRNRLAARIGHRSSCRIPQRSRCMTWSVCSSWCLRRSQERARWRARTATLARPPTGTGRAPAGRDSERGYPGCSARAWEECRVSSGIRDPGISDYEYRQRVRRYRPSSLLPLIVAAAARDQEQEDCLNSPFRKYTPWALADAARVCLAYSTEHNRGDALEQDLLQILNAYSRFEDPVVRDHDARACLLRMAGQQMTWQASEPQALARTAAIFTQTPLLKPRNASPLAGTQRCSDARCRSTWVPPSWPGRARSSARDASTCRCSILPMASSSPGT
jgi:hypothetical protein